MSSTMSSTSTKTGREFFRELSSKNE